MKLWAIHEEHAELTNFRPCIKISHFLRVAFSFLYKKYTTSRACMYKLSPFRFMSLYGKVRSWQAIRNNLRSSSASRHGSRLRHSSMQAAAFSASSWLKPARKRPQRAGLPASEVSAGRQSSRTRRTTPLTY